MKILFIYITGIFFLKKVFFPLFSFPSKKKDEIIFNQSPIIDLIDILISCSIIGLIIYAYLGENWWDWIFVILYIFYIIVEILFVIQQWNCEIRISDEFMTVRESKYAGGFLSSSGPLGKNKKINNPNKYSLKDCHFKFYRDYNGDPPPLIFWKKFERADYLSIRNPNDEEPNSDDLLNWDDDKWNEYHKWNDRNPTINLKKFRINNFNSKIISELSRRISSKNIEVKTNYFLKIGGFKLIYTILFIVSLIYYFI